MSDQPDDQDPTSADPAERASTEARIMQDRRDKLAALEAGGGQAWPYRADPTASVLDVRDAHGELEPAAETDARYVLAGRMMTRRGQGKLIFANVVDRSHPEGLQLFVSKSVIGEDGFAAVDD